MLRTTSLSLVAALGLAACETPPTETTAARAAIAAPSQPTTPATQISASEADRQVGAAAQIIANYFQDMVGTANSRQTQVRGAYAEGRRVTIEFQLPIAARDVSSSSIVNAARNVQRGLGRAICGNEIFETFILVGGEVKIDLYGRNGSLIDDFLFAGC